MTYRISYADTRVLHASQWHEPDAARTEYYPTEDEALERARELIEEGDHHAVSLADGAGNVLGGVRLQLRLGYAGD